MISRLQKLINSIIEDEQYLEELSAEYKDYILEKEEEFQNILTEGRKIFEKIYSKFDFKIKHLNIVEHESLVTYLLYTYDSYFEQKKRHSETEEKAYLFINDNYYVLKTTYGQGVVTDMLLLSEHPENEHCLQLTLGTIKTM